MSVAAAYDATGASWEAGPHRVYDRLAEVLVAACPGGVGGRRVLDLGAGTGAASRAAAAAGAAEVVAVDLAPGMLAVAAGGRPPAAVADAVALPFAPASFGAAVAAFSLNHLTDPVPALVEAARVVAPGGALALSAYAEDDTHPAKDAVEAALRDRGWEPAHWYLTVRNGAIPRLATAARARRALAAAGLASARAEVVRCPFDDLTVSDLVAWRLGLANVAGFVAALGARERTEVAADAAARLGPAPPPLVRSFVVATGTRPG